MNPLPLTEADLMAYADGQLAAARIAEVERALAADPVLAARVADMRGQSAELREALDPWLADTIPQSLLHAARPPEVTARWRRVVPYFAAAATLVLGVATGWVARDALLERAGTPTSFARQAALTHVLYASDVNRPVEIWAAEEKRLVTWLSRRLGFALQAPDLNSAGFSLVGGRLVAGNEKPTALFMYENADKNRLSLQVRKQTARVPTGIGLTGDTAFRYAVENGVGVFYWIDDDCGYAISGTVDRAQLLKIAYVVNGQLAVLEAADPK